MIFLAKAKVITVEERTSKNGNKYKSVICKDCNSKDVLTTMAKEDIDTQEDQTYTITFNFNSRYKNLQIESIKKE